MTTPAMPDLDKTQERTAFESAARAKMYNLTLTPDGDYAFPAANGAWWAWQAARSLPPLQVEAGSIDDLKHSFRALLMDNTKLPGAKRDTLVDALIIYTEAHFARQAAPSSAEGLTDTQRLDWLESAAENGCVTMCFEIDGGVHLTLDGVGEEQEAYRNQNSIRAGIDAAILAQQGATQP